MSDEFTGIWPGKRLQKSYLNTALSKVEENEYSEKSMAQELQRAFEQGLNAAKQKSHAQRPEKYKAAPELKKIDKKLEKTFIMSKIAAVNVYRNFANADLVRGQLAGVLKEAFEYGIHIGWGGRRLNKDARFAPGESPFRTA